MPTLPDPPEQGVKGLAQDDLHERGKNRALDLDVLPGRFEPPVISVHSGSLLRAPLMRADRPARSPLETDRAKGHRKMARDEP